MPIKSGPFNGLDRMWKAEDFAQYFASFIANGVFPNPSTGLQVVEGDNMSIVVKPGKCWINGYYLINNSDYVLQHENADGVLKRIDRIVARWDASLRDIIIVIKKGTFASNPVAPALQRDADAYELALADVLINNGSTQIMQGNITDNRLNKELCGIVHGLVNQVDTTTIFNQYQAWFNSIKEGVQEDIIEWTQQQQQEFLVWFDSIKDILDGDVAANLAGRIVSLEEQFATHSDNGSAHGIGDKSSLLTGHKSTIVGAVNELFTSVSNGKQLVGTAITDVDPNVIVPINPTFPQLADSIRNIATGRKWASGSVIVNSYVVEKKEIRGLNFKPSFIYFCHGDDLNLSVRAFSMAFENFLLPGLISARYTTAGYQGSANAIIYSDGFAIDIEEYNIVPSTWRWFAIE